jgi:hypothetical protein
MKIFRWLAGFLVFFLAVLIAVGLLLPRDLSFTRSVVIRESPEAIWNAIADCPGQPAWRAEIKSCERLPDNSGHAVFRLTDRDGHSQEIGIAAAAPPANIEAHFIGLPGGARLAWIFNLSPVDGGTEVSLTQNESVSNPLARIYLRTIFRPNLSDDFLRDLAHKFAARPPGDQ